MAKSGSIAAPGMRFTRGTHAPADSASDDSAGYSILRCARRFGFFPIDVIASVARRLQEEVTGSTVHSRLKTRSIGAGGNRMPRA